MGPDETTLAERRRLEDARHHWLSERFGVIEDAYLGIRAEVAELRRIDAKILKSIEHLERTIEAAAAEAEEMVIEQVQAQIPVELRAALTSYTARALHWFREHPVKTSAPPAVIGAAVWVLDRVL